MHGRSGQRSSRARGRYGEALAEKHLRQHGYRILTRNLHLRHAEIDLLALDGEILCFIEVRSRATNRFGTPEESVDVRKQRRLVRGARTVLARGGLPRHKAVRFDVVAIETNQVPPIVRLTRNAFYLP
ncbi:MAG: YraN family protein [Myxococcota bacterium]